MLWSFFFPLSGNEPFYMFCLIADSCLVAPGYIYCCSDTLIHIIVLRIFKHTPGTYPKTGANSLWRNPFHFGVWGCLGNAPRVCWGSLKSLKMYVLIPRSSIWGVIFKHQTCYQCLWLSTKYLHPWKLTWNPKNTDFLQKKQSSSKPM